MDQSRVNIPNLAARALDLSEAPGAAELARRLAALGGLPVPAREETVEYLVSALVGALEHIPIRPVAWSWGEFHNGGTTPIGEIGRGEDWERLASIAIDLGLDARVPKMHGDETLTPRQALARNLMQATEDTLLEVQRRLEAAGISPYGHEGLPRRGGRQPGRFNE